MPKEAKRLFLALNVAEISLVDEPANEKEIIVAKRKEQDEMNAPAVEAAAGTAALEITDTAKAAATAEAAALALAAAGTEVVEDDLDESVPDSVVEALKNLVENAANIATAKAKKAGGKPDFLKAQDKLPAFLKGIEANLKKAGMSDGEIKKAIDAAKAAFGASGLAADQPKTKTTTKAAGEVDAAAAAAAAPTLPTEDELVMGVLEAISKAKSFTPARIKKLVELAGNLDALLEELGIDKASFGASGIAATPTAATPSAPLKDTAASGGPGMPANAIAKAAAGEQPVGLTAEDIAKAVTLALEPVSKAQAELNGRLEAIEKARSPSTQPGDDGGDGKVPTTKSAPGMWSNVIGG